MPWSSYLVILVLCTASIALCRVAPAFLLKGRELPPRLSRALGYIPPAAFAALVTNDLFSVASASTLYAGAAALASGAGPDLNALGQVAFAWIAAAVVVLVAVRTKSLTWCIVVGVGVYGLLLLIPL
ncbi:MAG: AzlD domain-containing protein [Coriobacteriales bacterium]|jgi:branched-subunit amino acid transport protein|nr:AzlD domain-containing protein [Coriobacteriales bacterium]